LVLEIKKILTIFHLFGSCTKIFATITVTYQNKSHTLLLILLTQFLTLYIPT